MDAPSGTAEGGLTIVMKLKAEDVRFIMQNLLDDVEYWDREGKDAEKQLAYIAGVMDTAEAVMRAIEDL